MDGLPCVQGSALCIVDKLAVLLHISRKKMQNLVELRLDIVILTNLLEEKGQNIADGQERNP
jgi:hypothetical protein